MALIILEDCCMSRKHTSLTASLHPIRRAHAITEGN
ncbi:hypothetical protein J2Y48_002376 [Mycoplana sp. BE70]|nr:hypothetical protein [Mycoplana sp. BE70]